MSSVLSLFAGVGGLDLGLEAVGYKTRWYSEVDPYASRVMATRFPTATNLGDISEIDWSEQERPTIICGGFPCQDISIAGKGAGIDGQRSGLWAHYANAIRTLRPDGVLVENVAALIHRGIDRVLGDLAACGYDAEWDCIPAAAVGAPHLRDRVFIIAYRSNTDRSARGDSSNTHSDTATEHELKRDAVGRIQHYIRDGQTWRLSRSESSSARESCTESSGELYWPGANSGCRRGQGNQLCTGRNQSRSCGSQWPIPERSNQWLTEPELGRVADGVPDRVDRLRCLGNAVVPQVAAHVALILRDRISSSR